MKTSELIAFLVTQDFTDAQAYNLIVADLFGFGTAEDVARGQELIRYFEYKITEVLLPVIRQLKAQTGQQK